MAPRVESRVRGQEVVEATLAPEGPLGVTWRTVEVVERWAPEIEAVAGTPGDRARSVAAGREAGKLVQVGIGAGSSTSSSTKPGEPRRRSRTLADEITRRVAARLGARRVEVRGADGVVGVRSLR